jgi:heptosyltransferase-1
VSGILFIKTSSLGDVIHQMPAVTDARHRWPDAHFAWIVEEAFVPLVRLHPAVSTVIAVAARRWRRAPLSWETWREVSSFVGAVRKQEFDHVIDSQGLLLKSALISAIARGRRHGYDATSIRERAALPFYDVRHRVAPGLHAVARNRILTGLALGYVPQGGPEFGLESMRIAGREGAYAVLLHATARPRKEWPEAAWVTLGKALQGRVRGLVLPWGTNAERLRSERIAAAVPGAIVPERQSLDALAALIAGATFVIGVDTGLLHLAAALGAPVIGIFVGSDPGLTGPTGCGPIGIVGGAAAMPPPAEVVGALDRLM